MVLTKEQLLKAVKGYVVAEEQEGYIFFSRFTEAQRELYRKADPDGDRRFLIKTYATTGMRLDLMTDAEEISLEYFSLRASTRSFWDVDLYVDNVMIGHFGKDSLPEKDIGKLVFPLPAGEKRVTLYFPNLYALRLGKAELKNATFATPREYPIKLLCYGDSITQGYDTRYPSLSYANQLARELDAEMTNKAIGGDIFFPALLQEDDGVRPDLVTVAYGTNDWRRLGMEEFTCNVGGFMKGLAERYPAAKIVVITPIWRGTFEEITAMGRFEEMTAVIRREAEKYHFAVLEGLSIAPHDAGFFVADQLHPNDMGHLWYGRELAVRLKEIL